MSCVFLCNLHFQHLVSLGKSTQKRRNRLSYLEIHRSVLDLQNYIVMILPIKTFEIIISGSCPVCLGVAPVLSAVIYKASPDDDPAIRSNNISQHISTIRLSSSVSEWSRSSLGICLNQESSKIWKMIINLFYLILPPLFYLLIKRIADWKSSKLNRRSKVKRQIELDTVIFEYIRQLFNLVKKSGCDQVSCCPFNINIVDNYSVYTNTGHKSRIINCSVIHNYLIISVKK